MRRIIPVVAIVGFLAVAVFGVAAMDHAMDHGGCVASVAQGIVCPSILSVSEFLTLHQQFYLGISSAVFVPSALAILLAVALLLAMSFSPQLAPMRPFTPVCCRVADTIRPLHHRSLARWFSLLETSPTMSRDASL